MSGEVKSSRQMRTAEMATIERMLDYMHQAEIKSSARLFDKKK